MPRSFEVIDKELWDFYNMLVDDAKMKGVSFEHNEIGHALRVGRRDVVKANPCLPSISNMVDPYEMIIWDGFTSMIVEYFLEYRFRNVGFGIKMDLNEETKCFEITVTDNMRNGETYWFECSELVEKATTGVLTAFVLPTPAALDLFIDNYSPGAYPLKRVWSWNR